MEKKKKHLSDFERGLTKKDAALEPKTEQITKDQDRIKTKEADLEDKSKKLDVEHKRIVNFKMSLLINSLKSLVSPKSRPKQN